MNIKETYKTKAALECTKIHVSTNQLMKACGMLSESCNHPITLTDAMQAFRSALLGLQIAIERVNTEEDNAPIPLVNKKDSSHEELTNDDIIEVEFSDA